MERLSWPAADGGKDLPDPLDLATVIKVSQAVSGEIVHEKLLATLMRTAIEHAGAERGLLVLAQDGAHRIAAEATTTGDGAVVQLRHAPVTEALLPQSVLHHVLRTQESVILEDADDHGAFAADSYIRAQGARSVLCLPLLTQAKLIGALYLENRRAPRVFGPARIAILKLLASQAAISLENARLYRDLAERESRIRRLVDANIIGIFIWDLTGRILEANDAFLRLVGYERQDLAAGSLRWTDLAPSKWREQENLQVMTQLRETGSLQPYEKEYFRKDGSSVPVLIGAAAFEGGTNQGVAFVLDQSERKRTEEEARRSERRHHEMEIRLTDANRIASIGQLSASLAHELNQPLASIVTNASTCVRRLGAEPPNVPGAAETAQRLIRDAKRASEVVRHMRALFARRESASDRVDVNEAAREVVALSAIALHKERVSLWCEFQEGLPPVQGDRIQLQQVIMNLLRNASDAMKNVDNRSRQLVIRTERCGDGQVRLTVRDTGVGLDSGGVERLFEAFYTTKSEGMGIGLSVSRSIIERHHGRLWGEPNDGPGASFSFSVPVAPGPG